MDETQDEIKIGARNSQADAARIQAAHDTLCDLGAECKDPTRIEVPDPEKSVVCFGGEVKLLGEVPEGLHVGGYLVRFSTEDDPDLTGDYFTAETDFDLEDGEKSIPIYFNHGMPLKTRDGGEVVITRKIGKGKIVQDDKGLVIDAILFNREEYERAIGATVKSLGWSSGALGHLVQREMKTKAAYIKHWPIGEGSLTPTPADPRNSAVPLKSLIIGDPQEPSGALGNAASNIVSEPKEEGNKMEVTKEDVKSFLVEAWEEIKRAEPATVTAGANVTVIKDEADQPFKSHEFFQAVKNAPLNPRDEDKRLRPLKATGMGEGVPADGGYLVPPAVAAGIQQVMFSTGAILSRVAMDSVSGNSMTYNILDETTRVASRFGGVVGYWLNEGGTKTATAPKFKQLELKLKKVAALCYATDELLADANALNGWITRNVPDELRFQTEAAMFYGDGIGKPLGFVSAPGTVSVTRVDANKVQIADVVGMYARRLGNGPFAWFINREVMVQLMQLAGTYQYVWMPPGGLADSPFARLLGYPVIEVEYASALGTVGDIVLADMGMYQAITKGGIEAASSIHVKFTTDETAFRFVYRVDGAPMLSSAITPHKGSGTLSPFVTLSTAS